VRGCWTLAEPPKWTAAFYLRPVTAYVTCETILTEEITLEDLGVDGRILSKWILKKYCLRLWSGLNWFKIWASGGLLITL
jgi:hypothetical protein